MSDSTAIRTIHHLSCSGGTVMSQCIAVCGNPYFLSEINPAAQPGAARFAPMDIIGQLQARYRCLTWDDRRAHLQAQLALLTRIAARDNRPACLRDHAHGDFLQADCAPDSSLLRMMDEIGLPAISLATLRHPLDAFVAMQVQGWDKAVGQSLDEYSRRAGRFVDACVARGMVILRYEDFCIAPERVMRHICAVLHLPYNPGFAAEFGAVRLTGNSGRSGSGIALRPRREISADLARQAADSGNYAALCRRLGYDASVAAHPLASASGGDLAVLEE